MTEFPSFEFVVGDKNTKGQAGSKGIFGSPLEAAVGKGMRIQPK